MLNAYNDIGRLKMEGFSAHYAILDVNTPPFTCVDGDIYMSLLVNIAENVERSKLVV
jgi:hypothetical protein